jgi:hypothetical protein
MEPHVISGAVIAYRLFDMADAVDMARAQALWAGQAGGAASSRGRLTSVPVKAVAFGVPPLVLAAEPVSIELDGGSVSAAVTIRVYDFGVVSLAVRVPVGPVGWADFCVRANSLDRALGPSSATKIWTSLLERLRGVIAGALVRPAVAVREEDYLIAHVQEFSEKLTARDLPERIDLVALLADEPRPLSDDAREEILRRRFSYYADDMAVLTWDRAFIYEPRGDSDVMDIIEVANAQVLQMRYYDELLDAELPRMYEAVGNARRGLNLFRARRFSSLARRFHTLVAEVTELTEKLDNALQVTEDVYLARIYAAALELFRVHAVNVAVNRKLAIIRETYTALYDEASASLAEMLEILVILLITAEIGIALFRH